MQAAGSPELGFVLFTTVNLTNPSLRKKFEVSAFLIVGMKGLSQKWIFEAF